jgi:hypothetical protein
MNCWNFHPIPQVCLPLTSVSSQNSVFIAGQRFSSNQEAIAPVEVYFADVTKNHYRGGIMALDHRWNKCVILTGDYVEK